MKQVVAEVIEVIRNGQGDDRLQWESPNKVKLKTCDLFPKGSAFRMTPAARRKCFRSMVAGILIREGWGRLGNDLFEKSDGER